MLSRFHLSILLGAGLFYAATGVGQDFNTLVDNAGKALDKGNCQEARDGFAKVFTVAQSRAGVATPAEQIQFLLLLTAADICLGDFEAAAKLAVQLPTDNPPVRAQVQFLLGESNKGKGSYLDADPYYVEAIRIAESLPDKNVVYPHYLTGWADLARLRGQFNEAQARIQQALSLLDKSADSIDRAYATLVAADLARDRFQWKDARILYAQTVAIAQAKSPAHPAAAAGLIGLTLIDLDEGKLAQAETDLKQAQDIGNNANVLDARGLLDLEKRNLAGAEQSLKQSLDLRRKARPELNPRAAISLDRLGLVYAAGQRWKEAQQALSTAEATLRQTLGGDHPQVAATLTHLAMVYRSQRKFQEARQALDGAMKIEMAKFGAESLPVAGIMTEQANLLADANEYAEAEILHRQALAIEEKNGLRLAPLGLASLKGLALALHGEGKDSDASPLIAEWMTAHGETLPLLDPERLPVGIAAAEILLRAAHYSDAEVSLSEILAVNDRLGKDAQPLPLVRRELADALFGQRKWKEVARQYEASLPALSDQPRIGEGWENLGLAYAAQNLWPEAIGSYLKALEIAKKGRAPSDVQRLTMALAEASFNAGRSSQGAQYVSEWLPLHTASNKALTPEEVRIVDKSASILADGKDYAAAETALNVLLDAGEQAAAQGVNINRVLIQLAEVCAAQNKNARAAHLFLRAGVRSRAAKRFPDSEKYLLRAANYSEKKPGPHSTNLIAALQELGETYLRESKFSEAQPVFEKARDLLQQNDLALDPRMAISLNGLGAVQEGQKNPDEAAKLYRQSYELLKQAPDPPARVMASVLYHIGSQMLAKSNVTEAAVYFDQCRQLFDAKYTSENPPPVEQIEMIAGAYERQQRFDDAAELYKRNLELRTEFFGENSSEQGWGLYSMAGFLNGRKQYDDAAQSGERALQIFEAKSGAESDEVALVLIQLSSIYSSKGDLDRALAATARSAEIQQKLGRPRDEITSTLSALGEYYRKSKNYQKALDTYLTLAKLWEPESFTSPNYRKAAINIASAYVYLNDLQNAKPWYDRLEKALQQQRDTMQLPNFAHQYGEALKTTGHDKEARRILSQAGSTSAPSRP
jgi:tetratricopeptide (TPR) repeat protein